MIDELICREAEMTVEAARAAFAVVSGIERILAAGRALAGVAKPTWGAEVAEWHDAADALTESIEVNDAYAKFPPTRWWA
jgi:hypothetical protein